MVCSACMEIFTGLCGQSPKTGQKTPPCDKLLLPWGPCARAWQRYSTSHQLFALRYSTTYSWLTTLSKLLGHSIIWQTKKHISASKPSRFPKLPDLRVIMDRNEILLGAPKDLKLQNLPWSQYKHHNTANVLIGVAPNSAIKLLSSAYGGRLSDKQITLDSGILDKYDMIQLIRGSALTRIVLLVSYLSTFLLDYEARLKCLQSLLGEKKN